MIRLTCPTCTTEFETADKNAGKTGRCPNCQGAIPIPETSKKSEATAEESQPVAAQVDGNTVTVQVPQVQPANGKTIGPKKRSVLGVFFFQLLWPGGGHMFLGQTGKGLIKMIVDIVIFGPLIFITCGLGLILFVPWHFVWTVDAIIITYRIRKGPVSKWRFF